MAPDFRGYLDMNLHALQMGWNERFLNKVER